MAKVTITLADVNDDEITATIEFDPPLARNDQGRTRAQDFGDLLMRNLVSLCKEEEGTPTSVKVDLG